MVEFHACYLGKFGIQRNGQSLEGSVTPKAQELLSYLVLDRRQPHSRDALSELLWDNHPPEKSRKYLRQALWRVQSALSASGTQDPSPLMVDSRWIRFDPAVEVWVDVEEFEGVYNRVSGLGARELSRADFDLIQRTVALYQGNFLDGWYQDWCLVERERYQRIYIMMLDKLVQYCEVHEDFDAGLVYASEILRFDRAHERAHRQMIRLYLLAGDRTQALRQFERCQDALREELGVGPSERTTQLHEQIRADTYQAPAFRGRAEIEPDSAGLKGMLNRLEAYAEILDNMRAQVRRDIVAIEDRLGSQK
jgi:DNA-binding SARP family transcriptional activator